jgi:tetratricopeptide (TPR) repeat protein
MFKTHFVCLALVMVPTSCWRDTARECAQDKNYDLRILGCSDIIRRYSRAAWAYVNRGIAYSDKGDQDRAIADFTTAIWINPREVEAYNSRGLAHDRKGDCDLAIADFNRAMEISPGNPVHYNNRGVAYQCKQDYDQAFADYNRALAINELWPKVGDGMNR